jgi:hypothetical protein
MKNFKYILLTTLLSINSFAAGECSNDSEFSKICGHVKSTIGAVRCVEENDLKGVCGEKISHLGNSCSKNEINACETALGSSNAFESCLAKSQNPDCAAWGQKYQ